MANSPFELPNTRPASMTESGSRVYLYPADYTGPFRWARTIVYWVLLAIFLVGPWIRIHGNPAILLDLPHRRFSILGLTFWGHEAPILVLVFLSFVFTIGIVTALFGRIWCGWACPQTVFIDRVFRFIERLVEGPGSVRRKRDSSPVTIGYLLKKGVKWLLFLAAALIITHSFLMYFVGTDAMQSMIHSDPRQHWGAFLFMAISTLIVLFDFGWFREQFCIVACPYGKFQSVIMDRGSLVVGYDAKRGEPRMKDRQDTTATGDCVNCYRCVQVCPTGVDIRRGTQLECIMCTACIDACDTVMTKVGKPKGLVRYASEAELAGEKLPKFRPRVLLYATVLVVLLSALAWVVYHREMVPVYVQRPVVPYSVMPNGTIINERVLTIRNQYFEPISVSLALNPKWAPKHVKFITPISQTTVGPGQSMTIPFFIEFPKQDFTSGSGKIQLDKRVVREKSVSNDQIEVQLVSPLL